jgi:hypothetical protein
LARLSRAGYKLQRSFPAAKLFCGDAALKMSAAPDMALFPDAGRPIEPIKEIFMKRFATPRTFAAILILSLGFAAGGSFAAPGRGDHHGMRADVAQGHALAPMFHERALARLRDELKLDAQQENLWKEARTFAREQRDAIRARVDKSRDEIKALLEQPGGDLRAVARRMDELRAEGLGQRDAIRDRWFAVYDALDAEQKEKVRLFLKDGAERTEHLTDRSGERRGRGHPRRDGRGSQARNGATK